MLFSGLLWFEEVVVVVIVFVVFASSSFSFVGFLGCVGFIQQTRNFVAGGYCREELGIVIFVEGGVIWSHGRR
jgi:hypothetical protein